MQFELGIFTPSARLLLTLPLALIIIAVSGRRLPLCAQWDEKPKADALPTYIVPFVDEPSLRKAVLQYVHEPDNQVAFFHSENYFLRLRKYQLVEKTAKEAMQKHPQWAVPYFVLAKVADVQFDDTGCLACYQKAVKAAPNWLNGLYAYADKLASNEEPEEAVKACDQGLKVCGNSKDSYVLLYVKNFRVCKATALCKMKDFRGAVAELEKAPVEKQDINYQRLLADCYKNTKQWPKALAISDRLVSQNKDHYVIRLQRAQFYAESDQPQKAIDDLTVCLTLQRFSLKESTGIGAVKVMQERDVRILRAQMYEKLGKKDLAEKDRAAVRTAEVQSYKETPFRTRGKDKD